VRHTVQGDQGVRVVETGGFNDSDPLIPLNSPRRSGARRLDAAAFIALVSLVAMSAKASAQGEWQGRVLADTTRQPVAGARLLVSRLAVSAVTDSSGRFRITGLSPGTHLVITSALGYRPDSTTVDVIDGEVVVQDITVRRRVIELGEVRVAARADRYVSGKMVGFEERWAQGIGRFIDRDLLEKNATRRTSDILAANAPGVDVRRGTKGKAWAVSGRATSPGKCAMCRNRPQEVLDPTDIAAGAGVACYMDVWLDGVLVYDSSSRGAPLFDLNGIDPRQIEGVELYTSAAQIPTQFNRTSGGCGVVVIWTRV